MTVATYGTSLFSVAMVASTDAERAPEDGEAVTEKPMSSFRRRVVTSCVKS